MLRWPAQAGVHIQASKPMVMELLRVVDMKHVLLARWTTRFSGPLAYPIRYNYHLASWRGDLIG